MTVDTFSGAKMKVGRDRYERKKPRDKHSLLTIFDIAVFFQLLSSLKRQLSSLITKNEPLDSLLPATTRFQCRNI